MPPEHTCRQQGQLISEAVWTQRKRESQVVESTVGHVMGNLARTKNRWMQMSNLTTENQAILNPAAAVYHCPLSRETRKDN